MIIILLDRSNCWPVLYLVHFRPLPWNSLIIRNLFLNTCLCSKWWIIIFLLWLSCDFRDIIHSVTTYTCFLIQVICGSNTLLTSIIIIVSFPSLSRHLIKWVRYLLIRILGVIGFSCRLSKLIMKGRIIVLFMLSSHRYFICFRYFIISLITKW